MADSSALSDSFRALGMAWDSAEARAESSAAARDGSMGAATVAGGAGIGNIVDMGRAIAEICGVNMGGGGGGGGEEVMTPDKDREWLWGLSRLGGGGRRDRGSVNRRCAFPICARGACC